jgi:hypothetical protein
VRCGDCLNLFEKASPFFAQQQLLIPAILRTALPCNQTLGLKLVKQQHESAGKNATVRGKLTLIFPSVVADPAQDANVRRGYAESFDLAAKT